MVKICQCRKQNKQTSAANTNLDEFNDELELIMGDSALGSLLPQNCIFSFQLPATPLSNLDSSENNQRGLWMINTVINSI
jgi:hypothetical protein